MYDLSAIMTAAHARVRTIVAQGWCKDSYARLFRLHLRLAWQSAKAAAAKAAREALAVVSPNAARIAELEHTLMAEECRNRLDLAHVARLRREISELKAA